MPEAKVAILPKLGETSAADVVLMPVSTFLVTADPLEVTEGLIKEAIENNEDLSLVGSGNTVSGWGEALLKKTKKKNNLNSNTVRNLRC